MDKRNKFWRRQQMARVFKARKLTMQRNSMNILSKVTIWGNKRPESVLCVHVFGIEPCIINTFQRRT